MAKEPNAWGIPNYSLLATFASLYLQLPEDVDDELGQHHVIQNDVQGCLAVFSSDLHLEQRSVRQLFERFGQLASELAGCVGSHVQDVVEGLFSESLDVALRHSGLLGHGRPDGWEGGGGCWLGSAFSSLSCCRSLEQMCGNLGLGLTVACGSSVASCGFSCSLCSRDEMFGNFSHDQCLLLVIGGLPLALLACVFLTHKIRSKNKVLVYLLLILCLLACQNNTFGVNSTKDCIIIAFFIVFVHIYLK